MSRTAIVTDSNSGITQKEAGELGIRVLPMPFDIGGKEYFEDLTITQEEFYEKLASGAEIFTSQPSPAQVTGLWDEVLSQYDDLVYIPMSSGLSGSCQTARLLAEDYEGRVQVVDNHRISVTMRQSVLEAMSLAGKGMPAADIRKLLEEEGPYSSIYIMVDTLTYLKKGGRITPMAAAIGSLLKIKPVLQIRGERLDAFAKARTVRQACNIMLEAIRKDCELLSRTRDGSDVQIDASYTPGPGIENWLGDIMTEFPGIEIYHAPLSLSVSCHIGPGALAITATHKI
ncbi:MAG: DegV family protein [Lachnospiraceae bacterium]|nr:DegV family protein [Lachnospiraceae bacterium]